MVLKARYDRSVIRHEIRREEETTLARSTVGFTSDRSGSLRLHRLDLQALRLTIGVVVATMPHIHWYKVQLGALQGTLPCCALGHSSLLPFGVRDAAPTLAPGSQVIVALPYADPWGIIIGAFPPWNDDPGWPKPDWIVQGSNIGFKLDSTFNHPLQLAGEGDLVDFSAARPLDSTCGGEWGMMADSGIGIFVDSYMTYLRVDETCGLFLSALDSHARLAGWNFDLQTGATEEIVRHDEGEPTVVRGIAMYANELLGRISGSGGLGEKKDDKQIEFDDNYPFALYDVTDDQRDVMPFYRFREYGGYVGQLHFRSVVSPPQAETYKLSNADDSNTDPKALFAEHIAPDGGFALRSSKRVVIAKRAGGGPERRRVVEDTKNGDTQENYRFAGKFGNGADHKITDLVPESSNAARDHLLRAAATFDLQAYLFNWQGLHSFHYHLEDYRVANENDLELKSFTPIDFSAIRSGKPIDQPTPTAIKIDDRYGDVSYYPNTSALTLNDDGGVSLECGYGSGIRMVGGDLYIDAPGRIFLRSGSSVHVLAGDDLTVRAKSSIDLSATDKDVRIKAEKNMELLGGNSGTGGILIESRGQGAQVDYNTVQGEDVRSAGILLRAPNAPVYTMAQMVYLRTGGGDDSAGSTAVQTGPIIIDASRGVDNVYVHTDSITRFIRQQSVDLYGEPTAPTTVNAFSASAATIGSNVAVTGQMVIAKKAGSDSSGSGLLLEGNFAQYGSAFANLSGGMIGQLDNEGEIQAALEQVRGQITNLQSQVSEQFNAVFEERLYADSNIGNTDIQTQASFGFRTTDQYNASQLAMLEAQWAALARLSGSLSSSPWIENTVVKGNSNTFPFPGEQAFEGSLEPYMRIEELKLFSIENKSAVDLGEDYEEAKLAELKPAKITEYPSLF